MTLFELLTQGTECLERAESPDAGNDAKLLLLEAFGLDMTHFLLNRMQKMPEDQRVSECVEKYREWIARRAKRVPLQQILGSQEFMGMEFFVNEHVLIPRQDTEILVEEVLKELHDGMRVLDMCTGSGCILLSLLHYSNDCEGLGVDLSAEALEVAGRNVLKVLTPEKAEHAHFLQSDLFEKVEGKFEIIVSNPPYIASAEVDRLMPEVRDHEPRMALDGTEDGLEFYRRIIAEAGQYLVSSGMLFFEIGYDQGQAVSELMRTEGYREVQVVQDYAGLDRVVFGTYVTVQPAPFAKSR